MTNLLMLAARRTAAVLFPSVPLKDRARILAAMEAAPSTPAPGCVWGSTRPGAGQTQASGADAPAGRPGIPPVEHLRNWRPAVEHRHLFHDANLAVMVDEWGSGR